jgi:hypothetical protein
MSGLHDWVACRLHGHYPTISMRFANSKKVEFTKLLFDSGSDRNYVSTEVAVQQGLSLDGAAPQHWAINGVTSTIRVMDASVLLHDGESTKVGMSQFWFIAEWSKSYFATRCNLAHCGRDGACEPRKGLISTKLLADSGVSAVLDGATRTLRLV